jgi:hypothetical protein
LSKLSVDKQDYSAEATQLANDGDGIVITTSAEQMGRDARGPVDGCVQGKPIATNTSTFDQTTSRHSDRRRTVSTSSPEALPPSTSSAASKRYLAEVKEMRGLQHELSPMARR